MLFFAIFSLRVSAQQWKNYTNGLNVNCVAIDKDTVWIGSDGGVAKYLTNGTRLAVYTKADGLAADYIIAIAIDSQDNKWFGTGGYNGGNYFLQRSNGVSKFDGTNWTTYNSHNSGLMDSTVTGIVIDKQGNKWFETNSGVFFKFDGTNWSSYTTPESALVNGFSPMIDSHGNTWYVQDLWYTVNGIDSLIKFDGFSVTKYPIPSGSGAEIDAHTIDSYGNIWIGSVPTFPGSTGGLLKFNGNSWTDYSDSIRGVSILAADKQGNVWFGDPRYIYRFGSTGLTSYFNNSGSSYTVGTLTSIAFDSLGNPWMGVRAYDVPDTTEGVYGSNGTSWIHLNPSNSGLNDNYPQYLAIDHHNIKWVMTLYGGIYKYDDVTWMDCKYTDAELGYIGIDALDNKWFVDGWYIKFDGTNWTTYVPPPYLAGEPNSIVIDEQGTAWGGSPSYGLFEFNNGIWTVYDANNSNLNAFDINAVAVDQQNNKWVGTSYKGAWEFNGTTWTSYSPANSGLPDTTVNSIAIDGQGNKWFGTSTGGVAKFDGNNWVVYNTANSGLPGNWVNAIAIDRQGNMWFATQMFDPNGNLSTGIARFDGTNWRVYDKLNSGLSDNCVNSISFDKHNNVWLATCNEGISELLGNDSTFMVSLQFNENICNSDTITLNPVINFGVPPYSYLWRTSGNSLSCNNCQHPVATITQNSTFIVEVTDSANKSVSDTLTVYPCINTGIQQDINSNTKLSIYPNPCQNHILFLVQNENLKAATMAIYTVMGQTVYTKEANNMNGSYKGEIDVSNLTSGIYILQVVTDGGIITTRFMKQ